MQTNTILARYYDLLRRFVATRVKVIAVFAVLTGLSFATVSALNMPVASAAPGDPAPAAQPSGFPARTDYKKCPEGSCIIKDYVNPAIKALSALVGVAVTISIVVGGIQYASSTDDASKVAAAKDRITKAIIALICFLLLYGFLNFIIPGGVNGKG